MLRIRAGRVNLWLPLPAYVLTDLVQSLEDLCEVILPRFGLPNYARSLHDLLRALIDMPENTPLIEVYSDEADVVIKRIERGGH